MPFLIQHQPGSTESWNEFYFDWNSANTHTERFRSVKNYIDELFGREVVNRSDPNPPPPNGHEASTTLYWIARVLTEDLPLRQLFNAHGGRIVVNCHTSRKLYAVESIDVHLYQGNTPVLWDIEDAQRHVARMFGYIAYNQCPPGELAEYRRFWQQHSVRRTPDPSDEAALLLADAYVVDQNPVFYSFASRHPDSRFTAWFRRRWANYGITRL